MQIKLDLRHIKQFMASISLLLVLILVAPLAQANVDVYPCHNCTSEYAWQAKANQYGPGNIGYLYSFQSRQIRKFRTEGQLMGAGGDPTLQRAGESTQSSPSVQWLTVEANYQQQFQDMLTVRDYFGVPLSAIRIPIALQATDTTNLGVNVGGLDVYTVLTNSPNQHALLSWLQEQRASLFNFIPNAGVADGLSRLLQSIDRALTHGELLKVTYEVTFTNGSKLYVVDTGEGWPTVSDTWPAGVDQNNNFIQFPDRNNVQSAGMYNIHNNDLNNWIYYMQSGGVQVSGSGSGSGGYNMSCSWDGHQLHCAIQQH